MINRNLSRTAFATLLAITFFSCSRLFSQAGNPLPQSSGKPSSRSIIFSAANRWQFTPVDIGSQTDTVTPQVRAQRNAYWGSKLEWIRTAHTPLPGTVFIGGGEGTFLGDAPELPSVQHAIWVIAKFEAFHVYATDPQFQLLYTEMNFRVKQVIRQPDTLSLSPGALVDCTEPDGRIKTPSGAVVTFNLEATRHSVRPGHTYLLQLEYIPSSGHLFHIYKSWDVTSGKVQPNQQDEVDRAVEGKSKLNGLTIPDAVQYLNSVLPAESNK